jgi:E1A/CREB-binding protein
MFLWRVSIADLNSFIRVQEAKCPVPFCLNIKQKLRQQQLQQRLQEAAMMRRRMAQMNAR